MGKVLWVGGGIAAYNMNGLNATEPHLFKMVKMKRLVIDKFHHVLKIEEPSK